MGNANSLCDFCCCCKCHDVAAQQPVTDPVMAGRPPPAPEASAEAGKPLTSTSATRTCTEQGSTSASAVAADEAYQNILDISKHGVDGDLTALISYARSLLDYAKGSQSSSSQNAKPQRKEWKFVDTTDLGKFKDLFSETADAANSLVTSRMAFAQIPLIPQTWMVHDPRTKEEKL